ncbi:MAG: heparan-alpha-glucosaminide N-acetyltransferase domain-containing protein [Proteobacteria bacterium]|nr:heparan-alpha-glucosaminide N-acetyltransferase domain-containing protein [Pseudomonadota bacterium]
MAFNKKRLISLDVFRGFTIALMIIVNSPGSPQSYSIFQHSAWHGCSLADLVFPFFIFIMGLSLALALNKEKPFQKNLVNIFKRSLILLALGLFLNLFPRFDFEHLRFYGVLQRLAFCYFIGALIFIKTNTKQQISLVFIFLLGYYFLMTVVKIPGEIFSIDTTNNLSAYIDRLVFSPNHLYGKTFDPEGLLSSLPSIATLLIGMLCGQLLKKEMEPQNCLKILVISSLILLSFGASWGLIFPINKALWTSSYVLWTAGLALLLYAFCYWLIEIKGFKKPFFIFELLGLNALFLYFLHVFFLKLQNVILIHSASGSENLKSFISHSLFSFLSENNASFAYALSYTLFWIGFIYLWQRKLYFKKDLKKL